MQIELSLNTKKPHYFRWANIQNRGHRRKGRSRTRWYGNGQKSYEGYYVNGDLHNPKGPAMTKWHNNGQKDYEVHYVNGERHNTKGPAYTRWHANGRKDYEVYYINGECLTKRRVEN